MPQWQVSFRPEASADLSALDGSQRTLVLKAIKKVSQNPLPSTEGGFGKPLGNHIIAKLAGYYKIKLKKSGLRVVYELIRTATEMRIIVISVRDDAAVYQLAEKRIR